MSDYERIAQVIRYLDAHHAEQPDLATLAGQVGLSPAHFHRLFSAWAGVTPKDFLQCLTLTHAKALLQQGASVLDTALAAGCSGPGRVHDLCVSLEAASPGEIKSGGLGWQLRFGFAATPFGEAILAESHRGICHLAFVEDNDRPAAQAELERVWPQAQWQRDDATAARLAASVFQRPDPAATPGRFRAFVKGSPFQVKVWQALLRIPPGTLVTYGRLAAALGQPTAARAVGSAVGSNLVGFLIPCHRVIRETGAVGGYRWGTGRKQAMLAWENAGRTASREANPEPKSCSERTVCSLQV